jgi:predicted PurR-regulated permease PerM
MNSKLSLEILYRQFLNLVFSIVFCIVSLILFNKFDFVSQFTIKEYIGLGFFYASFFLFLGLIVEIVYSFFNKWISNLKDTYPKFKNWLKTNYPKFKEEYLKHETRYKLIILTIILILLASITYLIAGAVVAWSLITFVVGTLILRAFSELLFKKKNN